MSLFNTLASLTFLKEDSDNTQHIARLKELQDQATGKVKDAVDFKTFTVKIYFN